MISMDWVRKQPTTMQLCKTTRIGMSEICGVKPDDYSQFLALVLCRSRETGVIINCFWIFRNLWHQ